MKNQQLLKGIKCRQIIVITTRTSRVEVVCFEMYTIKAMTVWILPAPFRNHSPPDGISSLDWVKASSWAGPMVLVIGGSFHLGTFFSGKNPTSQPIWKFSNPAWIRIITGFPAVKNPSQANCCKICLERSKAVGSLKLDSFWTENNHSGTMKGSCCPSCPSSGGDFKVTEWPFCFYNFLG